MRFLHDDSGDVKAKCPRLQAIDCGRHKQYWIRSRTGGSFSTLIGLWKQRPAHFSSKPRKCVFIELSELADSIFRAPTVVCLCFKLTIHVYVYKWLKTHLIYALPV